MRRSRDARFRAVSAGQYFRSPLHGPVATTDSHQRSGDVSHHVLQEGIRRNVESHEIAISLH